MLRKVWDSYSGRILWGSLALFLLLPTLVGVLWKCLESKFSDGYTLGVYIGTGIAILWYTVETYYLRREVTNQNEITVRPLIIVNFERRQLGSVPAPNVRPRLVMRNIGSGLAMFIRIRDMTLVDPAGDRVKFTVKFDAVSYLEKGQEYPVEPREYVPASASVKPEHLNAIASLDPKSAVDTYNMRIDYQDIRGRSRWTEIKMGIGGVELLEW